MRYRHGHTAVLLIPLLAACSNPADPTPLPEVQEVLADSVELAPGAETVVGLLRLSFVRVGDDSRCPIDATCIWQGTAAVDIALAIGTGASVPHTLNTSEGTRTVDYGGFRVHLLALGPDPRAGIPIPQDDYRAAFRIESLTDSQ